MRKLYQALEPKLLFSAGTLLLGVSAISIPLRRHLHAGNPRLTFALAHIPAALFASALFTLVAALLYPILLKRRVELEQQPTTVWIIGLSVLFGAFWLPVLLSSGFVQDDWMLLAAASIRNIIPAHPLLSWNTLDSVDGNFRPLGAVLYLAYALRLFGLHPTAFLAANFLLNLGSTLSAFFIVRGLGYGRPAAATAAILFMSRGILYTQSCWIADLGDCIVLFLTAQVVLFLLRALQRTGTQAILLHVAAWALFALSTLAKQSAFATPLIVAALLFVRPGPVPPVPFRRRLTQAFVGLLAYGAVAASIFQHARSLLGTHTPYPMQVTFSTVLRSFAYFFWYFFTIYFPARIPFGSYLCGLIGIALLAALILLLRRYPSALGERPRDLLFLALAAAASVSLFLGLVTRNAAYYGTECAFWISIAFGIMLTRFGSTNRKPAVRVACFLVCLFAVTGFLDIRLKQIGFFWAGGYVAGNSGTAADRILFDQIRTALTRSPNARNVILVDPFPIYSWFTSMVLLLDPSVERIFVYLPDKNSWLANDHEGLRPADTPSALADAEAYNWRTPIARERVLILIGSQPVFSLHRTGSTFATSTTLPGPGSQSLTESVPFRPINRQTLASR